MAAKFGSLVGLGRVVGVEADLAAVEGLLPAGFSA